MLALLEVSLALRPQTNAAKVAHCGASEAFKAQEGRIVAFSGAKKV